MLSLPLVSCPSRAEICDFVGEVHTLVHETWLPGRVRWLMGVDPGGFKLNEPLNVALGTCVLALLRTWHATVTLLLSILPPPQSLLLFLVPGCCLGASISVAIISDVLALLLPPAPAPPRHRLRVRRLLCCALLSIQSLRGAKYNVLRKRVDHCDYDMEQRLLGTLFFTGTGAARMSTSLDVACQLFIQSGTQNMDLRQHASPSSPFRVDTFACMYISIPASFAVLVFSSPPSVLTICFRHWFISRSSLRSPFSRCFCSYSKTFRGMSS